MSSTDRVPTQAIQASVLDSDDPAGLVDDDRPFRWRPSWRVTRPWRVTVREYERRETDDDGAYRPHVVRTGVSFQISILRWAWVKWLTRLTESRSERIRAWAWRRYARVIVVYEVPEGESVPERLKESAGPT
jgi:hypothetical protein